METAIMDAPPTQAAPSLQTASPSIASWLLPGLVCSGLLFACFFPLAWGFLAWCALAPLLWLVRIQATKKRIFFGAYLSGLAFFFPVLSWMPEADYRMYYTWVMLATYCALYFPAAIGLTRVLERTGLPLMLTFPAVWVGLEFVRSFLLTGFAWYYLGHSQHQYLPMIQLADITGVYGISFLLAMANAWLFETWFQLHMGNGVPVSLRVQAGILAAGIVGCLVYGHQRMTDDHFELGPRVALLQPNIDSRLRNEAATQTKRGDLLLEDYHRMHLLALRDFDKPQMVIWPETTFPFLWFNLPDDLNTVNPLAVDYFIEVKNKIKERFFKNSQAAQLLGIERIDMRAGDRNRKYNTALLFDELGRPVQMYDKMHRVPFGEYIPFRDWLPFMNKLSPYDFDHSIEIGEHFTRFKLGKYHFGVIICYEDTDPFLAREYVRISSEGPPVDFLVNISNDGWFNGSWEHDEHLAICRFRAVETRRAVARSVNMGISAIIDSNGKVQKPTYIPQEEDVIPELKTKDLNHFWAVIGDDRGRAPQLPTSDWHTYKKSAGVLLANIPIDRRGSFYAQVGDWLPMACWLLVLAGMVVGRFLPTGERGVSAP